MTLNNSGCMVSSGAWRTRPELTCVRRSPSNPDICPKQRGGVWPIWLHFYLLFSRCCVALPDTRCVVPDLQFLFLFDRLIKICSFCVCHNQLTALIINSYYFPLWSVVCGLLFVFLLILYLRRHCLYNLVLIKCTICCRWLIMFGFLRFGWLCV